MTSLTKATILFWTNPIFVALYSRIFLKERLSIFDWVAIFLAFIGVVLLQNPFGRLEDDLASISSGSRSQSEMLDYIGSAVAILGSLIVAFAFMFMRKMAGTVHYMVPPMYFAMFSTVLSPVAMIYQMNEEQKTTILYW